MLINPRVETQTDFAWICDDCGTMLNEQAGFMEDCGEWTCKICGHVNKIDESVYEYLMEHPVSHMPRIIGIYKGFRKLVVIEEYIDGKTIADILEAGVIKKEEAVRIARDQNVRY